MSRSRRRDRDRVRRDYSVTEFQVQRARPRASTFFVPLDIAPESNRIIYPERRKPARVYTPIKAALKFQSPFVEGGFQDVSGLRECVQRTVRKQVIHALGLAGAKRIFSKAGAGKKTPSRRKC